ncbi:MAG: GGDEF domain-containing protein [Bilophila sp.]|nr:GGDEF domain-containing protein [Bilophila sp.]
MTAPLSTDEATAILSSILMDPQWSADSIAGLPEDDPFGKLCCDLAEIRAHVQALSKGDLSRGNKARGFVAGSLKATEANLRHLTWQMERVSQGDYSQSVSFMGDFSKAFNKMSREMHSRAEELSRLLERYRVPADEDTLTGLLNRRTFFKLAMSELRRAKEFHQDSHPALCLALADLDNFKNVNGHFGHANGDRVLQLFACRLREASHDDDLCCRFGGDEFIILIPRIGRDESIEHVNRLREICSLAPTHGPAPEMKVTASFGLSFIGESELLNTFNSVEILEHAIQVADHRLARAKQEGRNRICSAG